MIARIPGAFDGYAGPALTPARDALVDVTARATIVSLFTLLVMRIAQDFVATGRLTGLLLLGSESLVVILTVIRRPTGIVDRSWQSRVLTGLSMIGPPLLVPTTLAPWLPGAATVTTSALALLIVIAAKVSLGRSFGLLPANRGVVVRGCYRFIRHPIYLGYLIGHVSFLAANPSPWNIGLLGVSDIALLRRAMYEERTLARDDQYRSYMDRVRWRVIPGVF
jgi:protein-S-isoprenylcysteine O-methyltransferase Ste14